MFRLNNIMLSPATFSLFAFEINNNTMTIILIQRRNDDDDDDDFGSLSFSILHRLLVIIILRSTQYVRYVGWYNVCTVCCVFNSRMDCLKFAIPTMKLA